MIHSEGWYLYAASQDSGGHAQLRREEVSLSEPTGDQVLAQPQYGCWEGNMEHALRRQPIDVCAQRGEPRVILGNAGVVRVLAVGPEVRSLRPGDDAILFGSSGAEDQWGYPTKILGYDAPGTMGCLAKHMALRERQLVGIPKPTRYSLAQWAAFSVRYVTAWANWAVARGVFRLLVSEDELVDMNVWGWGGGTTLAELQLAAFDGCKPVMLSGNPERLSEIGKTAVTPLDRRAFGELSFDPERYKTDATYKRRYAEAEAAFLREVRAQTDGEMVQVFVDMIGTPVYRASLRALSRAGVITTAGWKCGMELRTLRASECISWHQHVFTHGARYSQGVRAVAFAEASGWMPTVDSRIYSFDEIPLLADDFRAGRTGLFPVFSISPS